MLDCADDSIQRTIRRHNNRLAPDRHGAGVTISVRHEHDLDLAFHWLPIRSENGFKKIAHICSLSPRGAKPDAIQIAQRKPAEFQREID